MKKYTTPAKALIFTVSFIAIALFLFSCNTGPGEEIEEMEEEVDPDSGGAETPTHDGISIPGGFNFSMVEEEQLIIHAEDSNGVVLSGALFYIYSSEDFEEDSFIANGQTDNSGSFEITLRIPQITSQLYVKTIHKDLEPEDIVVLDPSGYTEVTWDYRREYDTVSINSITSFLTKDTDGDGMKDINDWDDDNDGLLDSEEFAYCKSVVENNVTFSSWYHSLNSDQEPTGVHPYIVSSVEKLGPGWTGSNYSGSSDSRLDLSAEQAPQNLQQAINGGYYIEYSIAPRDGYVYNLRTIGFAWTDVFRSPKHSFTVSLLSNLDGYSTPIFTRARPDESTAYQVEGVIIDDDTYKTVAGAITFRAYLYAPSVGGQPIFDATGDNIIIWDDFSLGGKLLTQCDQDSDGIVNAYDEDSDGDMIPDIDDPEPFTPSFKEYIPSKTGFNSYAFESSWPVIEDSDFNDVVVGHRYELDKNDRGLINQIKAHFQLRALGDVRKNGFGFMLEGVNASQVGEVRGTQTSTIDLGSNGCELGHNKAVVIVYDDGHSLLGGANQLINVTEGNHQPSYDLTVTIVLNELKQFLGVVNPFIFTEGNRAQEVHLKGYRCTNLANKSLFNSQDDGSTSAITYQTKSGFPWALHVPGVYQYPLEGKKLSDTYPNFKEWVESAGFDAQDWFEARFGNPEHLYNP